MKNLFNDLFWFRVLYFVLFAMILVTGIIYWQMDDKIHSIFILFVASLIFLIWLDFLLKKKVETKISSRVLRDILLAVVVLALGVSAFWAIKIGYIYGAVLFIASIIIIIFERVTGIDLFRRR